MLIHTCQLLITLKYWLLNSILSFSVHFDNLNEKGVNIWLEETVRQQGTVEGIQKDAAILARIMEEYWMPKEKLENQNKEPLSGRKII
jgi:hypothetical protein